MSHVTTHPLISLITVTYNAEKTVGATMKSVASQSFGDYEHIIMDGISNDTTLNVADNLKTSHTRVFSSSDTGIYDAMNKALKEARGTYVLFINAGDRFADEMTLQRFADRITDKKADIIYGQTVLADLTGNILGPRHLSAPLTLKTDSFKDGMVVCHQAFMVKREIAPQYNLKYRFSADYEWCILCCQHAQNIDYLGDEPVIHYLYEGLTTKNHKTSLLERFNIMMRYYGVIPTIMRHVKFAVRYMMRRKQAVNNQ